MLRVSCYIKESHTAQIKLYAVRVPLFSIFYFLWWVSRVTKKQRSSRAPELSARADSHHSSPSVCSLPEPSFGCTICPRGGWLLPHPFPLACTRRCRERSRKSHTADLTSIEVGCIVLLGVTGRKNVVYRRFGLEYTGEIATQQVNNWPQSMLQVFADTSPMVNPMKTTHGSV